MSGGNFKYDFKDMAKYMEDMAILRQYGGSDIPETTVKMTQAVPKWKSILHGILYVFLWAFTLYALYIVYYIIFKGYPKWIINLFTGSMSNKADMDKLLKENNVLFGNFNYLLDKDKSYRSIYSVFKEVYGDANELGAAVNALDVFINENFDYPYEEKYMMAFREYFLFFFKIITDRIDNKCNNEEALYKPNVTSTRNDKSREQSKNDSNSNFVETSNDNFDLYKIIDVRNDQEQNVKACIHHYQFYEALKDYLVAIGKLNKKHKTRNGDKNDEELIYQVFMEDMAREPGGTADPSLASNGRYYTKIKNLKELVIRVSKSAASLNSVVNNVNNNVLPYLVLPSSANDIKNTITDYSNNIGRIGQIYDPSVKFTEMNEFSWYIFEALTFSKNNSSYDAFSGYVKNIVASPEMRAYLNLSSDKRSFANQRLKMELSEQISEITKKCPVFSHIYFSEIPGMDKRGLYVKVMSTYNKLMNMDSGFNPNEFAKATSKFDTNTSSSDTGDFDMSLPQEPKKNTNTQSFETNINNLDINGGNLKKTVNAINILHLYLNQYALAINQNYEKQYTSDKKFLKELITPLFHELIVNRVFIAWYENIWRDSLFGPPFPTKNYKEFKPKYKWLEDLIGNMVKATWKRLFTTSKINEPKPAEQGL
jgi:hypothetical protein